MAVAYPFSPEALAQIAAARSGPLSMPPSLYSQPGTLSPMDPLYGYAQNAPVLSLAGNKEHEALNFQALPGTNYQLVVGGQVVGSASSPEEVAQLVSQANQFSEAGGAKADVKLEKQLPYSLAGETDRRFVPVYENNPNGTGLLGTLIPAALAAMSGGALAPFMGAGGMLGTGLYAGLGSIAGSLATGSPLGEALKKGAITGITAGGLSGLGAFGGSGVGDAAAGQVGSSLSPAFTNAISTPLVSGLTNVADDALISVLANTLGSGAGAGLSSAAGGVLGSVAGSGGGYQPQPDDPSMINVTGVRTPVPVSSGAPSLAAGLSGVAPLAIQAAERALAEQAAQEAPAATEDEIVVTANPQNPGNLEGLVAPLATLGPSATPSTPADVTPKKPLGVSDYLRLAGLVSTALGALGGGDKGTAAGTIPGGLGGLNPIFSAKLPETPTNIPGGVGTAGNFAVRPTGDEDWLTYGQRPEKSFFNYVPQPPTAMAHGGSLAAKRGGKSERTTFAVNGPGTGRSDDIEALLSDGEYVIDAETVALLGDGSSKAGAQKLDDLRVKIRKHKGQKLAQGRFSANAKKPEAYLSGGRI